MSGTSWGNVSGWYDEFMKESSNYQKDVVLPNLLRVMNINKGDKILDLACGQGFFSGEFLKRGAEVVGCDISKELISLAEKDPNNKGIKFFVSFADDLSFIDSKSLDKIVIVLAIQNIANLAGVFKECDRTLKDGGKLYVVMNHPAFRIPKKSFWGFDEEKNIQYRRIDSYMSESKVSIDMNPGEKSGKRQTTVSFHRSLQIYFKVLKNSGFCVGNLEEWISNRKSQEGPKKIMEDTARKEFPLFMYLEVFKK